MGMRRGLIGLQLLSAIQMAMATDFVVLTRSDSGPGSLRQGILDANAAPGADRVVFNIPGAGVQVISVATPLPQITDSLVIDGYTQPGARANSLEVGDDAVLLIRLNGAVPAAPAIYHGLAINAPNCVIRGLSITNFIRSTPFAVNGGVGIAVSGGTGSVIEGCFLGVTPDGITSVPNGHGVDVFALDSLIGGTSLDKRNIVSGNADVGLFVGGDGTIIAGNYVGTDSTGRRALSNPTGIQYSGSHTRSIVGGTVKGAGNLVSGNLIGIGLGAGVNGLEGGVANGVAVQGNLIGTAVNGVDRLGNGNGVVVNGSQNFIGGSAVGAGNLVAYNQLGVVIRAGTANRILSNAIYTNSVINISLDAGGRFIPNDIGDGDFGANNYQNFPVIQSVNIVSNSATIKGNLNSTPNTQFTIQLFSESQRLTDSAQTYIGSTNVTTDANGDATFSTALPVPGPNVTINATATSASGDTSELFLNQGHFRNISTRVRVETGDNVLIGGFILSSGGHMAVRALGPSLISKFVRGPLQDPVLGLYRGSSLLVRNDNWGDDSSSALALQRDGLAPNYPAEAAFDTFLSAGTYTVVVRGKNETTGVALVELYDLTDEGGASAVDAANISTRGLVQTGDDIMIGGTIISGGDLATRVVVRGIGPSLASFGIANPLLNPVLELRDSNGILLGANDNWKESQETDLRATGLAPQNDAESAILMRLGPGNYTAVLRGKADSTGVALVEFYNIH